MQPHQYTVRVTKLEAAGRQLETAIDLYFRDGDPVSIHTLCCAAYDVIHVLNKQRNDPLDLDDMMLKDFDRFLTSRAEKKLFHDSLNAAQNFFKHGSSDTSGTVTLDTRYTEWHLYEAVQKYARLVGQCSKTMALYTTWFATQYPEVFSSVEMADSDRRNAEQFLRVVSTNRERFYAEFLPVAKAFSL